MNEIPIRNNFKTTKETQSTQLTKRRPYNIKSTKSYLFDGPFSFKELKVSFNHLKLNITLLTKRKALKFSFITIYNSFCIKFQPKCQVLLSNLLKGCNSIVSRIKGKRLELNLMENPYQDEFFNLHHIRISMCGIGSMQRLIQEKRSSAIIHSKHPMQTQRGGIPTCVT
jgi:hypothetical protein